MTASNPTRHPPWRLMLGLASAAAGMLYGLHRDATLAPSPSSSDSAPASASRPVPPGGHPPSAVEMRDAFLTSSSQLDAQLSLARWIETASSTEIAELLGSLGIASPESRNTHWDDQAALVASLWAAKDGRAAIAFVSSHRVARRAALEAGRTWALHDPAAAASWLRDEAGLTRGECAGVLCGLAVSDPGLAREPASLPGQLWADDLDDISSAVRKHGVQYFADWVNGVKDTANRKSIVTYQIRSGEKFQESLEIIRLFSDPALREQCYAYISRDLNPAQAADFFESIPVDERATAVTSLLCRTSEEEEGGELAADLMRKLPADQRERAVLRLLKEDFEPDSSDTLESMKQKRIETLERLVPDPEEREKIRAKWPEPLTRPPGSKEPELPEPSR